MFASHGNETSFAKRCFRDRRRHHARSRVHRQDPPRIRRTENVQSPLADLRGSWYLVRIATRSRDLRETHRVRHGEKARSVVERQDFRGENDGFATDGTHRSERSDGHDRDRSSIEKFVEETTLSQIERISESLAEIRKKHVAQPTGIPFDSTTRHMEIAMKEFTETEIEEAAQAAHEVNRVYCAWLKDTSQKPWPDAPEWQKASARSGVRGVIAGNTPEQSHAAWMKEKYATGWVFGSVKDEKMKMHPCLVEYRDLPPAQRNKDTIFVAVVRGVLGI